MPLMRKTLAKYGAKIPTARSTGAKTAPQEKEAAAQPAGTAAKAAPAARKGAGSKR